MSEKDENAELDHQIEQALAVLNPRQRKFALILGEDGETQTGAAVKAGYAPLRADQQASRMLRDVKVSTAVQLLRRHHQLQHGISAAWKRERLQNIVERSLTPGDEYNAHAANQALRTLCEMDGDYAAIQVKHSHLNVTVNLDYDIEMPGRVIEAETVKKEDK